MNVNAAARHMDGQLDASGTPSLDDLRSRYGHLDGQGLITAMVREAFPGRIALTSSFGAEAAVMLSLVAKADPATPILFIDTLKLFPETYHYIETLTGKLGLTDVRRLTPDEARVVRWDPRDDLWQTDPDSCCHIRKVAPLDAALQGFDAWITGRKRFHGGMRAELPTIEAMDGKIKINPIAPWSREKMRAYFDETGLPAHPLVADGYLSIGCHTCTRRVVNGEEIRAGRWAGHEKTECGIHLSRDSGQGI